MNERYKKIAEKAGFMLWADEDWNPGDVVDWSMKYDQQLEKFAQLIVQECISLVNLRQRFAVEDELNAEHAFDILVYDIEQHFGINHERTN